MNRNCSLQFNFILVTCIASTLGNSYPGPTLNNRSEWDCSTSSGTFKLTNDCVTPSASEGVFRGGVSVVDSTLVIGGVVAKNGSRPVIHGNGYRIFIVSENGKLHLANVVLEGAFGQAADGVECPAGGGVCSSYESCGCADKEDPLGRWMGCCCDWPRQGGAITVSAKTSVQTPRRGTYRGPVSISGWELALYRVRFENNDNACRNPVDTPWGLGPDITIDSHAVAAGVNVNESFASVLPDQRFCQLKVGNIASSGLQVTMSNEHVVRAECPNIVEVACLAAGYSPNCPAECLNATTNPPACPNTNVPTTTVAPTTTTTTLNPTTTVAPATTTPHASSTEWDCVATAGAFTRVTDCTLSAVQDPSGSKSGIILAGNLNVVGRINLTRITAAASGARHFYVSGHTLTLKWLALTGGNVGNANGGSIYVLGEGRLLVYSSLFTENTVGAGGGAIDGGAWQELSGNTGGSNISLYDTNITHNTAGLWGGGVAMWNDGAFLLVSHCVITHNSVTSTVSILPLEHTNFQFHLFRFINTFICCQRAHRVLVKEGAGFIVTLAQSVK
jgi:hypothetical protein